MQDRGCARDARAETIGLSVLIAAKTGRETPYGVVSPKR
jgi:hypothetical protein